VVVGRLAVYAVNRVNLDAAGLYPILTAAAGMLSYGAAASFGGSGFLAVYLAGIIIGNERIVFQKGILVFHDGAAWLAQIAMFVLLGLLAFPSQLLEVAREGLLVAAVLIFVARPIAVGLLLPWFNFSVRELAFVSWVGLKGAVPIVLATYPLMFGVENAAVIFNVIFFTVLVSAVLQGWTMPPLARILGLQGEPRPEVPVSLEITSLKDVEGDIVEYTVSADSLAAGRHVRDLRLPDGVVIAMIVRQREIIPPRGSTHLYAGDHVFVVLKPAARLLVDRVFRRSREPLVAPPEAEFPLRGDTTVLDLREFYDITLPEAAETTLHDVLVTRLGPAGLVVGARVRLGDIALVVRELDNGRVEQAGLVINPSPEPRS
jgi:cell volume regulation protein A